MSRTISLFPEIAIYSKWRLGIPMLNNGTHKNGHDDTLRQWNTATRWEGITRLYSPEDVGRLSGSIQIEYTLARMGAERLWNLLRTEPYVPALGALTGNQAVQQVQAGLKAIYVSGWQVAGDANVAGQMYPDQSLYPVNSVPTLVRAINNAFQRADQIHHSMGRNGMNWFAPIVADAEAGFGGPLNAFELMKAMIEAGAAAVHFEDQLASAKKCGHMGGKVVVPTSEFVQKLVAARFAADVMGVPTILIARTDANSAGLLLNDIDQRDKPFLTGMRTPEGFFGFRGGIEAAIARGLAYAPHATSFCTNSEVGTTTLPAHVSALLAGELILEVHAARPPQSCTSSIRKRSADRQRPACRIRHDGGEPIHPIACHRMMNLIGALEGVVDRPHQGRHALTGYKL